jgi:hypothetical protein
MTTTHNNGSFDLPLWAASAATQTIARSGEEMLQNQIHKSQIAQQRVASKASEEWKSYCLSLIKNIATLNQRFTSDLVMLAMTEKPHDPRALGPLMKLAQKSGYIRPTNEYRPSVRRHATPLRVWESLIASI